MKPDQFQRRMLNSNPFILPIKIIKHVLYKFLSKKGEILLTLKDFIQYIKKLFVEPEQLSFVSGKCRKC